MKEQERIIASGKVAEVGEALKNPMDYELTFNVLGWQLRHVGSDFSTLIREQQAFLFVVAMETAKRKEGK